MSQKLGKIFVVSGPSGVGKTTLVTQALERLKKELDISRVTTYTSRPAREKETLGKDYIFISLDEFKKKKKEDFFLETNDYAGHMYGSPKPHKEDLDFGKSLLYVLDLEGAKSLTHDYHDAELIWISPPDMASLKTRLLKRASDSVQQIEKRLIKAEKELEEAHKNRLFDYVLVNDVFEQAVEELVLLIKKLFVE